MKGKHDEVNALSVSNGMTPLDGLQHCQHLFLDVLLILLDLQQTGSSRQCLLEELKSIIIIQDLDSLLDSDSLLGS
jgi:hypothetical protein